MRIRNVAVFCAFLSLWPALASADARVGVGVPMAVAPPAAVDNSVDTLGKLLAKQAQVIESEMDAKIRSNQGQTAPGGGPSNATPLPNAKQDMNDREPIVEAIWGLVGKEVAEVNYRGRHVAVSLQEPYISKLDGWKLEKIMPYEIVLVRLKGNHIAQRKSITLDWSGGDNSQAAISATTLPGSQVITPAITAPVMR